MSWDVSWAILVVLRERFREFDKRMMIRLALDTYRLQSSRLRRSPREIQILCGVYSYASRSTRSGCCVRGRSSGSCIFRGGAQAFCNLSLSSLSLPYFRVVVIPSRFADFLPMAPRAFTPQAWHGTRSRCEGFRFMGGVSCRGDRIGT